MLNLFQPKATFSFVSPSLRKTILSVTHTCIGLNAIRPHHAQLTRDTKHTFALDLLCGHFQGMMDLLPNNQNSTHDKVGSSSDVDEPTVPE